MPEARREKLLCDEVVLTEWAIIVAKVMLCNVSACHPLTVSASCRQDHVAIYRAVVTGGGAVAVVTAVVHSTQTTSSNPTHQTVL